MKTNLSLLVLFLVVGTLGASGCRLSSSTQPGEGFAVYLTQPGLSAAIAPLISGADIVSYDAATHEIELTPAAYERVDELQVPVRGLPFFVCVDREIIYEGAFWTPISSMSYGGVAIFAGPIINGKNNTIALELGYPAPAFYSGQDPRGSREVMNALKAAGKLRD
jgi:hypothetical protein